MPMLRWFRRYWDEDDIWFYFELDAEGWTLRQVELQGADRKPLAAASLAEWMSELGAGRIQQYQAKYGALADQPIDDDEVDDYEPVAAAEFEQIWRVAREHLERH